MYVPKPMDTSNVDLPEQVTELVEFLSENAHERWAEERIRQGWSYGPARDDDARTHPCLVPYHDLPDSEKVLDRRLATETLKVIVALGFRILAPSAK